MKNKLFLMLFMTFVVTGCMSAKSAEEIMNLNRTGKWETARDSSLFILSEKDKYSVSEICQVYYNLAYAEVRLGEMNKAEKHLKDLQSFIVVNGLPSDVLWIKAETEKLKAEIEASGNS